MLARRYHLIAPLGRGTMGVVWEAYDLAVHRKVAVKEVVLPPDMSAQDREVSRERAQREARAISQLAHPNVIAFYDLVEEAGHPWVVMELVNSRSLADLIRADGPLQQQRIATLALAVLGALEAAHRAGITHRDVKPSNILLTDDGRVKLTDFGIARTAGDSPITGAGMLVGSPSYIPPEVIQGGEAGPAADMWGLGATLYAAVEARAPFDAGDPMATLHAVVSDPTPPTGRAGPLGPVIDGLLRKDPRRRLDTVKARHLLLDALRAFDRERAEAPAAHAAPAAPQLPPPNGVPTNATLSDLPVDPPAALDPEPALEAPLNGAAALINGALPAAAAAPLNGAVPVNGTPLNGTGSHALQDTGPIDVVGADSVSSVNGSADNGSEFYGSETNGAEINGAEVNGAEVNGSGTNGSGTNGFAINGVSAINGTVPLNGHLNGTTTGHHLDTAGPADIETTQAETAGPETAAFDFGPPAADFGSPATDFAPPAADFDAPPYQGRVDHSATAEPIALQPGVPEPGREDDTAEIPRVEPAPTAEPELRQPAQRVHPLAHLSGFDPDSGDGFDMPDDDFGAEPWRSQPVYANQPQPKPQPRPAVGGLAALDLAGDDEPSDRTAQIPTLYDNPPPRGPDSSTENGRSGRAVGVLLAVVALCVAGYGGYWLTQHFTGHHDSPAAATPTSANNTHSASQAPTRPTHRSTTRTPDFTAYQGAGYSTDIPTGWKSDPQGTGVVDFNDPHNDRFIRFVSNVESGGDLVAGFQAAEQQFNGGHQDYQRIGIRQVSYRGYPAADWEFTYTRGGELRHVLYRSFTVGSKTYGIYISAPDKLYSATLPAFSEAAKSFAVR